MVTYITLYTLNNKANLITDANDVKHYQMKAETVTKHILSSEVSLQALMNVIQQGKQVFNLNLDSLISKI